MRTRGGKKEADFKGEEKKTWRKVEMKSAERGRGKGVTSGRKEGEAR